MYATHVWPGLAGPASGRSAAPRRSHAIASLCLAAASAGVSTGAFAAGSAPGAPTALQARSWAAACAACHGAGGRAPDGSPVPGLAGQPQSRLIAQMQDFKSGKREATVMHQIAKGYTDAQIAAIAAWFAAAK